MILLTILNYSKLTKYIKFKTNKPKTLVYLYYAKSSNQANT